MSRTFSLTVRELLASPPSPGFVRLAEVDGLWFPEPLAVESIDSDDTVRSDPADPDAHITVWSPKGWMFSILLCPEGMGRREITVTFQEV